MSLTKQDFQDAIAQSIASYPTAKQYYLAGDPRLLAPLSAMAQMLAMVSQSIEIAETEPFLKVRDSTVLADASLKGILPLGKPCKVILDIKNTGVNVVTLPVGRAVYDDGGRDYLLDAQVTITPNATVQAAATQHTYREVEHTIAVNAPFYSIKVPYLDSDVYIESLTIIDIDGPLEYAPEFMIQPNADTTRLYHVETNELKELFVRFGAEFVHGYYNTVGTTVTLQIYDTLGEIVVKQGAQFTLAYIGNNDESKLTLTASQILNDGSNPHTIDVLRVLASYPALYDNNAVYLGNFDFIVRKFVSDLNFLSVWNERVEELVRPPSLDNINTLFISFVLDNADIPTTQQTIRNIIKRADDSYRVTFVDVEPIEVPLEINAIIAPVHDIAAVTQQIKDYMTANYGRESKKVSVGRRDNFNKQSIYESLKKNTVALQDPNADFTLAFGPLPAPLPEHWRYVTDASITVNISLLDTGGTGVWN